MKMTNKILVVDDEEAIRNLFERAFENSDYDIITAESGEIALDILAKENVKVMFLDLNLPGMNGVDLCKKVRQFHPLAIIHAITGYNSLFELVDCRRSGFDDYFTKPLEITTMYRAAKEAFDKIDRWGAI